VLPYLFTAVLIRTFEFTGCWGTNRNCNMCCMLYEVALYLKHYHKNCWLRNFSFPCV